MKLTVCRHYLEIRPESVQDQAYIEEVLGLNAKGDWISLVRENTTGNQLLGLRTVTKEQIEEQKEPPA